MRQVLHLTDFEFPEFDIQMRLFLFNKFFVKYTSPKKVIPQRIRN